MKALPSNLALALLLLLFPSFQGAPAAENPKAGPKGARRERSFRYEPEYQKRTFKGTGEGELSYGWMPPVQLEPEKKYPLVICLHGAGGGIAASKVLAQAPMRQQHPAFVMVPEASLPFAWAKTDAIKSKTRAEGYPEKLPVLIEAVHSLMKTEAVDRARIYITGQSMGGIGSWGAIARYPDLFAGAVPVCGAWRVEDAPKMTAVPVWAFHGEKDATVPVHFSRELTAALTRAGGTAKYTEYPGVGHASWTQAYGDMEMWKWLFAQHKPAAK